MFTINILAYKQRKIDNFHLTTVVKMTNLTDSLNKKMLTELHSEHFGSKQAEPNTLPSTLSGFDLVFDVHDKLVFV